MRIGDWSSDVCSSDLLVERADLIITTADNMSRELPGIGPGGALVLPMGSISTPSRPVRGNPVRPTSRQFRTRASAKIGRAHVCTPVTNAHLVCRLLLTKKNKTYNEVTNKNSDEHNKQ